MGDYIGMFKNNYQCHGPGGGLVIEGTQGVWLKVEALDLTPQTLNPKS